MRRFQDKDGVEYDEIPGSDDSYTKLRRRLKAGDKSPIPKPQYRREIEDEVGTLVEIDPAALQRRATKGERWRRGCKECGKTSCWGECTPGRKKGQRR